jgi:hypothetical protein
MYSKDSAVTETLTKPLELPRSSTFVMVPLKETEAEPPG